MANCRLRQFTDALTNCVAAAITMLLLAGCSTTPQVAQVEEEFVLPASASVFWQHILEEEGKKRDWFYLLNQGAEALSWRLTMFDSAHESIDMESFLWKPDQGGMRIMAHLLAAADRGVRVRLLLDDSFTPHEDLLLHDLDLHTYIEVRIYNPYHRRPQNMVGRTVFNLGDFNRLNHRMHNKALVVDGWTANVGGRNLADEYFGLHDAHNFRDMEVLTMGASVAAVSQHFDGFWNSGWAFPVGTIIEPTRESSLQRVRDLLSTTTGPLKTANNLELEQRWEHIATTAYPGKAYFVTDRPAREDPGDALETPNQLAEYLIELIGTAQSEVTAVTAYLIPTEELLAAIRGLRERGVRVRILTNSLRSNNHLSAHAAYAGYIRKLVDLGVELYELRTDAVDRNLYMQTPVDSKRLGLHAKFLLIDKEKVFIGSSNLDPRSLKLNTEVGLMIESESLNQALREVIKIDFSPSNAWSVRPDAEGKLSWISGDEVVHHAPADSVFQRLESWFIGLLPVDDQM